MFRTLPLKTAIGLATAAVLLIVSGCILDPKETVEDNPGPELEWPDRTGREDCIEIIRLVYKYDNIEKYKEALLKPETGAKFEDGYIWYNQQTDVGDYGPYYDYDLDWKGTAGILEHAVKISEFSIFGTEADWEPLSEFRGEECQNCWQSLREYRFDIDFDDGEHYIGNYKVVFVIGPDRDEPTKYVIYQATDTPLSVGGPQ